MIFMLGCDLYGDCIFMGRVRLDFIIAELKQGCIIIFDNVM